MVARDIGDEEEDGRYYLMTTESLSRTNSIIPTLRREEFLARIRLFLMLNRKGKKLSELQLKLETKYR